ncbi:affinity nitrate transporter 2 [Seminavis robusta]|uniref:Affinity nitrate transporter 2 n=1 Tax=Seminavis robusta TaxID=568900 RepID=A0A9N8D9B8_9STRA|nr:affinity nitrate transporter 2 [Seminavis robusta]|eukprot:Sro22_g015160.1 affinity nitrate transporter 2 (873) ;mRNA; r:23951-26932
MTQVSVETAAMASTTSSEVPSTAADTTTEESDKDNHNRSRDMTETTEPASIESTSSMVAASNPPSTEKPMINNTRGDDGDDAANLPAEESLADTEVASSSSTGPTAPMFYRLNAFRRDTDDDEDDNNTDGFQAIPTKQCKNTREDTVSTTCSSAAGISSKSRGVRFKNVCIREYEITIGDNPYCSYGVPICLDWNHGDDEVIPIDFFEASHKRRRTARRMLLNSFQRRDMLWRSGYLLEDIEKAIKANDREKFRRSVTLYFLPLFHVQELLYFGAEKILGKDKRNESQLVQEMVQKQQAVEIQHRQQDVNAAEMGGMTVDKEYDENSEDPPRRRLSFRSTSTRGGPVPYGVDDSIRSSSAYSDVSHERDDPYAASANSRYREYSVRVDRGQHDKATEIILCNLQRPHMRAFHAAWFSFFIAFFSWFAVTPLLGEIMETLNLTKEQIWVSSLCGTAGTIIMRIMMGPLCDKYGSRLCMAFILASSAIPCALTGLVETSQGLSAVRSFVGIAGSSFVACQYWTSQMFTREVAGTANALVAGWGNLGGGVTQLIMGSALFPLFKLFFSHEDTDDPSDGTNSSEMAWRTVFVVPALVSLITAYTIAYHCDDSPKGDYRERVRQQEIMVVSPSASLCAAAQNYNVWLLLLQYACCFGVEVTMTNATALYFRDEFGQTTVSAAAIASVFGFMNLFARGLGGFGSDLFNAKYGMRGRVSWQAVTLFMEGIGVVIFGFADTLAGSIIALIFLSFMVQSAEGSTFGIVPYVDRRFTGSVVGWVGAGGNVGGACFSVLFIRFEYERAFLFMGILASASSVLSFFLNCKTLARNAETLANEGKRDEGGHHHLHNEAIGMTRDTAITFAQLEGHEKTHHDEIVA